MGMIRITDATLINQDVVKSAIEDVAAALVGRNAKVLRCQTALKNAEQARNEVAKLRDVFVGLRESVFEHDPGKHRAAYFFLNTGGHRCFVDAFLPEGTTLFPTHEAWAQAAEEALSKRRKLGSFNAGYASSEREAARKSQLLDPDLMVAVDDLLHADCPKCGSSRPLIERYEQTEDGPDGDSWEKRRFVLCCDEIHTIAREGCDGRF